MKYYSRLLLSFLVVFCVVLSAFADIVNPVGLKVQKTQPPADSLSKPSMEEDEYWQWLTQQANQLDQMISRQPSTQSTRNLLKTDCERSQSINYREQALLAEADLARKDLGLYFDAGVTDEWDSDFESEDSQRAYVGLTWRVLEDGYREKKHRANLAEARAESEVLQSKLELRKSLETCRYDATRDSFAPVWQPLLTLKDSFLTKIYELQKESYLMGGIYLDDLLDSQRELKSILEHYRMLQVGLEQQIDEIEPAMPPLLDLDMAEIRQRIQNDPERERLLDLKHSILDAQSISNDDKRLRFYLRYNVHEDSQDNGPTVGAAFSMPLAGGRYSDSVVDLRKMDIQQEIEDGRRKRLRRSELAYGELLEQRERVVKQNYRYLAAYEQLRRTLGRHQWLPGSGEFKHAVTRMTTLIESAVELMRAVEEMYRRVHRVFVRAGISYSPELVNLTSLQTSNYRARQGGRSVYIWSDSFNRFPNSLIQEFVHAKGVSEVILSGSDRVQAKKLSGFLRSSEQKGIKVQMLVGDNSWLTTSKKKALLVRLEKLIERTGHLHIDVEPHTLGDFKQKRRTYLDNYQQLITTISNHLDEHGQLSISVPLHWDPQDYRYLDQNVDHIYLMAYEISRVDTLKRRLAEVIPNLSLEKVVIALRPEDFMNEIELESVIEQLSSQFGVEHFALHDLVSYLELSDGQ
ncbi:MAG: hypothetical protein ABW157_20350 [Candidatus Thiodiazotropha sp. LLP2]